MQASLYPKTFRKITEKNFKRLSTKRVEILEKIDDSKF